MRRFLSREVQSISAIFLLSISCTTHNMYVLGRMEVKHVRRFVPDVIWLHIIHCLTGGQAIPLSLSLAGKRFLSLAADRRVNQTLTLKYVRLSNRLFYCFGLLFFPRESQVVHPTHFATFVLMTEIRTSEKMARLFVSIVC